MKICVLCNGFPSKKSAGSIFVIKLFEEISRQGHQVTIIAPQSLTKIITGKDVLSPTSFFHETTSGERIKVFRPIVPTLGNLPILKQATAFFRRWAVKKAIAKAGEHDVFYAHFWKNGYCLYSIVKQKNKPLFVATGESVIPFRTNDKSFSEYVSGVICVSSKNMNESISAGLTTREKCLIIPNAIDNTVFRKMDKLQCRQRLGIDKNLFLVVYVGQFIQRKGYNRVATAIDRLNDNGIGIVFLGANKHGGEMPQCRGIVKCGLVSHDEIPQYLNASDVFVLPTRAEGCCNAIVEAMACGLPIISSDLPFNHDILNCQNALLIDPDNIEQITSAIKRIKDDKALQASLANSSLEKAQSLALPDRARKIISFVKSSIRA